VYLTNGERDRICLVGHDGSEVGSNDFHFVAVEADGEVVVDAHVDDAQEMRFPRGQSGHSIFATVRRCHCAIDEDII
jgi:hypothetical protein